MEEMKEREIKFMNTFSNLYVTNYNLSPRTDLLILAWIILNFR